MLGVGQFLCKVRDLHGGTAPSLFGLRDEPGDLFGRIMPSGIQLGGQVGVPCRRTRNGRLQLGLEIGDLRCGRLLRTRQAGRKCCCRGGRPLGVVQPRGQIGDLCGSTPLGVVQPRGQIGDLCGSTPLGVVQPRGQIGDLCGSTPLGVVQFSSEIGNLRGRVTLRSGQLCGETRLLCR